MKKLIKKLKSTPEPVAKALTVAAVLLVMFAIGLALELALFAAGVLIGMMASKVTSKEEGLQLEIECLREALKRKGVRNAWFS